VVKQKVDKYEVVLEVVYNKNVRNYLENKRSNNPLSPFRLHPSLCETTARQDGGHGKPRSEAGGHDSNGTQCNGLPKWQHEGL
jgi:hypothetical protein